MATIRKSVARVTDAFSVPCLHTERLSRYRASIADLARIGVKPQVPYSRKVRLAGKVVMEIPSTLARQRGSSIPSG